MTGMGAPNENCEARGLLEVSREHQSCHYLHGVTSWIAMLHFAGKPGP